MSLPKELVISLKSNFALRTLVEGGTYYGTTAKWAARHFDTVITVEAQPDIFAEAQKQLSGYGNVQTFLGNTEDVFAEIIPSLQESTVFWIDAHWSVGNTYGENNECPLLDELKIVTQSPHPHFIFIDDARFFLSPPPKPHKPEHWPTIDKVLEALHHSPHSFYVIVLDDVIIAVPEKARQIVISWCQEQSTKIENTQGVHPKFVSLFREVRKETKKALQRLRILGSI